MTNKALCSAAEAIVLLLGTAKQPLFERLQSLVLSVKPLPVERIIHAVPSTVFFSP